MRWPLGYAQLLGSRNMQADMKIEKRQEMYMKKVVYSCAHIRSNYSFDVMHVTYMLKIDTNKTGYKAC